MLAIHTCVHVNLVSTHALAMPKKLKVNFTVQFVLEIEWW